MRRQTNGDSRAAFAWEFLRNPRTVAAVTPSGDPLADMVTAPIPTTGTPVVVELGPGTGAFTRAIQRQLAGRGHHLAIEINTRFARLLAARYPHVDVAVADARSLREVLADRGHERADVIVSGLPWMAFTPTRDGDLLTAVLDTLSPHGAFTTFTYMHTQWVPPARRLRRSLSSGFEEVVLGRTVWGNLPPAFVYFCRRPRTVVRHAR